MIDQLRIADRRSTRKHDRSERNTQHRFDDLKSPFHYAFYDKQGGSIVVEVENGKLQRVLEILCHTSNIQSKRNDTCPSPSISIRRLRHSSPARH
ncbi:hypothetical protein F8762_24540 [Salmonella enterica]|nr:hypothetical protein CGA23_25890 [Salmonella enterica subsp. enterica]EAA2700155.1 hypothetical protein [Salmonella enterica]EAA8036050.1 hypothetical protein [Salmonella enterica subsp. enterica serovar Duisburg]EAQ4380233.1 hypothetical protein [Salmonella enterica subsp. enterica serovar Javiana]ECH8185828.1 hypothetical protein [Salmonella enterica subsp. enterica serovar Rissen]ECL7195759.1 hypothetical protein [Salmonella enterica subsp. enterica serovar Muenchen]EDV3150492.1 hypothe